MVCLIYGSPCSGKSTFINERIGDGDIVCDVDLLYEAISGKEAHDADLYAHETALLLKDHLLDIIRDRVGGWKDAYVVSIANTPEKVQAAKERVKADKCIFIDTPYEVCLERTKDRPPYFVWLVQEWFETQKLR